MKYWLLGWLAMTACQAVDSQDYSLEDITPHVVVRHGSDNEANVSVHFIVQEPGGDLAPEFLDLRGGDWASFNPASTQDIALQRYNLLGNIYYRGAATLGPADQIVFAFHRDGARHAIAETTLSLSPQLSVPKNFAINQGGRVTWEPLAAAQTRVELHGGCLSQNVDSNFVEDVGYFDVPALATDGVCNITIKVYRVVGGSVGKPFRGGSWRDEAVAERKVQ